MSATDAVAATASGPSIRESTIALTQRDGPKVGHHTPGAELLAAEQQRQAAAALAANGGLAPGGQRPSIRESTIALTQRDGPKVGHHVPPSELPVSQRLLPQVDRPTRYPPGPIYKTEPPAAVADAAAPAPEAVPQPQVEAPQPEAPQVEAPQPEAAQPEAAKPEVPQPEAPQPEAPQVEAAQPEAAPQPEQPPIAAPPVAEALVTRDAAGQLPSVRESTLAVTNVSGAKTGHHVPPQLEPPTAETGALVVADSHAAPPLAMTSSSASTAAAVVSAAATVETAPLAAPDLTPTPAVPELAVRDVAGRLPSVRESTIAMTQKYGPKRANHVPPSELGKPRPALEPLPPSANAGERQRGNAALALHGGARAANAGQKGGASASLLAKPLREWDGQDMRQAANQMMGNKVVMGALALGAAALTVFSVYKGVELYNRYRLGQSIAEVEREKPTVVHLYIHRRSPLAPSVSIPCTRIETLLRLAHVPYEAHVISDASVSPSGELPFVVFNGLRVAGAQNITDALMHELGVSLDRDLSREDQATGVALLSAVQYSLTRGYLRSVHVDRPDVMRPYYSEMNRTPDWVTRFALRRMQRRLADVNDTSGYAQLTAEQYVHELLKDVVAVEALLEHHTYLFSSDYPSSYDCALYAWLLPVVAMEDAAEVNEAFAYIVESELLTMFVRRMTELAFPDLDELVIGTLEYEDVSSATDGDTAAAAAAAGSDGVVLSSRRVDRGKSPSVTSKRPSLMASLARASVSQPRSSHHAEDVAPDALSHHEDEEAEEAAEEERAAGEVEAVRPSQREVRLPGERVRAA